MSSMTAPDLIARPARQAVRLIALRHLDEAETARRALASGDPEALHDFRVALRRLRTCLRAYPSLLIESIRPKDRRRLKALATTTGAARDLEVQLESLSGLTDLSETEEVAIGWLVRRLEARKQSADGDVRRTVDATFPAERARLERRLTRYEMQLDPTHPDAAPVTFGAAAAGLLTVLGARLEARLAGVRDESDQHIAHDARIAGKRLRYALEPLRAEMPAATTLVTRLKSLQDVLGDMHDADVLHGEIAALLAAGPAAGDAPPEAGLRSLMDRLARERSRRFEQARGEWLGTSAAPFLEEVRRFARELLARAQDGIEIERKYLLSGMPRIGRKHVRRLNVEQGWLPGERLHERVRRTRDETGTHWFRTIKFGRGVQRTEIEEKTTRQVFDRLWRLTLGRRVRKVRYRREHEGLLWEIDRFTDRELVLAEVELPSADATVVFPPWLEPYVVREVTDEDAYVNFNLAK